MNCETKRGDTTEVCYLPHLHGGECRFRSEDALKAAGLSDEIRALLAEAWEQGWRTGAQDPGPYFWEDRVSPNPYRVETGA